MEEPGTRAASTYWIASCSAPASGRTEAVDRASRLLASHLSDEQAASVVGHGRFRVRGNRGGHYEIALRYPYNITRFDRKGRAVAIYCIGACPKEELPIADQILAQKLMIEADEDRFLAIANCEPLESAQSHLRHVSVGISWSDLGRMQRRAYRDSREARAIGYVTLGTTIVAAGGNAFVGLDDMLRHVWELAPINLAVAILMVLLAVRQWRLMR